MSKCYLINDGGRLGEIDELEIIKETAKTFVIYRKNWGERIVKKAEMRAWSQEIRLTYPEALSRLKEIIRKRIADNKATIERLKEKNISLAEKLVKVEAEIEVRENE